MAPNSAPVSGSYDRPASTRVPDRPRLRVLIIDDNKDQCLALCSVIRAWGHEAEAAHNGQAAMTIIASFRPRVILLDLGLPDVHGYDLAKRIRAASQGRRLYFIVMTGWTQIADQLSSTAAGISHHFIKPVNMDTLRRALTVYG